MIHETSHKDCIFKNLNKYDFDMNFWLVQIHIKHHYIEPKATLANLSSSNLTSLYCSVDIYYASLVYIVEMWQPFHLLIYLEESKWGIFTTLENVLRVACGCGCGWVGISAHLLDLSDVVLSCMAII